MALDTTAFLLIFAAAITVMGAVALLRFRLEHKRERDAKQTPPRP